MFPAVTVHRNCASGMEALTEAAIRIQAGRGSLYLVAGVEAMSKGQIFYPDAAAEWLGKLAKCRTLWERLRVLTQFRLSYLKPRIGLVEGLTDPVSGLIMGLTAENLAREFSITREEQDAFAKRSHARAQTAAEQGWFDDEIAPILPFPLVSKMVMQDNGIRRDVDPAKLARMKPYFDRRNGSVTVANSCQVTDGAAAMLLTTEARAAELGLEPCGILNEFAYAGLDPARMGLGPVFATNKLLKKTGGKMSDFELVELNEAFAAQVLACQRAFVSEEFAKRELDRDTALGPIDDEQLNVQGGAIALGHPVGATGLRLVLTLLQQLQRQRRRRGLATLCIGGGQGAALDLEVA